jgi:hypothetical protein
VSRALKRRRCSRRGAGQTGARAAPAALACAAVLCGCGGATAPKPKLAVHRPGTPVVVRCAKKPAFDARAILGFEIEAARAALKRRGCTMRVIERGGRALGHPGEYVRGRLDVGVTAERIVRIVGES